MDSRTELISHTQYLDSLENLRKLMVMTEFILEGLESEYVDFLKGLINNPQWEEFQSTISNQIIQFDITNEDIQFAIREMIPVI